MHLQWTSFCLFFLEWEFLSNSCFIIYSSGIRANSCCWTFCSPWACVDTCSCHFCSPHGYRGPLAGTLHPPPHAPPSPMGLFVGSMSEEPEPAVTTGQTFMATCRNKINLPQSLHFNINKFHTTYLY